MKDFSLSYHSMHLRAFFSPDQKNKGPGVYNCPLAKVLTQITRLGSHPNSILSDANFLQSIFQKKKAHLAENLTA
jgi:hypothetical protein